MNKKKRTIDSTSIQKLSKREYSQSNIPYAKGMRKEMTKGEFKLWCGINRKQLGYKFRRQYLIGPYIIDFACLEKNLVIEVDGSQHCEKQKKYDDRRTKFLNSLGYKVIRFWNFEIIKNFDGCMELVVSELNSGSDPSPNTGGICTLPQGEGYRPITNN